MLPNPFSKFVNSDSPSLQSICAPTTRNTDLTLLPLPEVEITLPQSAATGNSANAAQVGGDHYKQKAIQPWDYIVANNIGYLEGNIIKYVSRYKEKNGKQDLEKAKHYLEKLLETL